MRTLWSDGIAHRWPILLLALAGLLSLARPYALVMITPLIANTFSIGATYTYDDRFMIPVRLVLCCLAAVGLRSCGVGLLRSGQKLRRWQVSRRRVTT